MNRIISGQYDGMIPQLYHGYDRPVYTMVTRYTPVGFMEHNPLVIHGMHPQVAILPSRHCF